MVEGKFMQGRLCSSGALPWRWEGWERDTYTGTVLLSTGHQPWISQVLWVPLNSTHWPVFMP